MNKFMTIFTALVFSSALLAEGSLKDQSVKIIYSPNQKESVPSVITEYLKPMSQPKPNETEIRNAPFEGFDARVSEMGLITIIAEKPTAEFYAGEVGGYTGGLEYRATFSSAELLELGVSVIPISRPEMSQSFPGDLRWQLKEEEPKLDKFTSIQSVAPYIEKVEVEVSGEKVLVKVEAVGGYLIESFEEDVGGITGDLMLKGQFSISEYEALIGPDAASGYSISETTLKKLETCTTALGPAL